MEVDMVRRIGAIDQIDAPIEVKSTEEPYKLEFLENQEPIIVTTQRAPTCFA